MISILSKKPEDIPFVQEYQDLQQKLSENKSFLYAPSN